MLDESLKVFLEECWKKELRRNPDEFLEKSNTENPEKASRKEHLGDPNTSSSRISEGIDEGFIIKTFGRFPLLTAGWFLKKKHELQADSQKGCLLEFHKELLEDFQKELLETYQKKKLFEIP